MSATRTRRRLRASAATMSVLLHVAVISALVLARIRVLSPGPVAQPIFVALVAAPRAAADPARAPPRSAATVKSVHPLIGRPPTRLARSDSRPQPAPSTAAGEGAVKVHPATAAPRAAPLPAKEMQPDLKGLLRATVGCSHQDYLALTPVERSRCNDALLDSVRIGREIDALSPDKRAAYDRQALAEERKRDRRATPPVALTVNCDGPKSNLGASCLPEDAIQHMSVP